MKEIYDVGNNRCLISFLNVHLLYRGYWFSKILTETQAVRITYPLVIAITALARLLYCKISDPPLFFLIYSCGNFKITTVIVDLNSKYLKIDKS